MSMAWIVALSLVAAGGPAKAGTAPTPAAPGAEPWRLTLSEAIRIGVKNSPVIRVVEDGDAIRVARTEAGAPAEDLRSALMAHVRSIEQQYWALSEQQIGLWSREKAVGLFEEIVARERAELEANGRGGKADVAEAQQRLEGARLALVAATSDTMTTERQLRNILGLPPVDGRRIVAATAPLEARIEPAWETSLAAMMAHQPEILRQREAVAEAEGRERAARDAAKPTAPAGLPADVAAAFDTEYAKVTSDRRRVSLQQAIHQSTHTLARFFLEIDANYKQFQTAKRLRESARARLEQARASFEEGRTGFTIDKLLDAVSQYADAIAQEAQYKASYNTSIAALEEAKGTLLAERRIVVVDSPAPAPGRGAAAKAGAKWSVLGFAPRIVANPLTGVIGVDFDLKPASFSAPAGPKADARPASPAPGGRVIKYDVTIEGGPIPIGFKGTVSIGSPAPGDTDGR